MSPQQRLDLANQILKVSDVLGRIEQEQHLMRADIRELRQEVGLSLPPVGAARDDRAAQRAWFHLRVSLRYGIVAGAGAAATWLLQQLATLLQ